MPSVRGTVAEVKLRRVVRRARLAARARSERSFAPALRAAADGPVVVLSPHPDDAVLSCWSVLSGAGDVRVVNVFIAAPRTRAPQRWDVICGARDAREHAGQRMREDRRALDVAARRPDNLRFVDWQYREHDAPPSLRALDRALRRTLDAPSMIYAPAVIGHDHPDHVLLRTYALRLAAGGVPVRLYADLPYCAGDAWPRGVAALRGEPAEIVLLDPEQTRRKQRALRCYETQFAPLCDAFPDVLDDPQVVGHELFWTLPGAV